MNKRICVQLDEHAAISLETVRTLNRCSISDVVNAALIAFSQDTQPVMMLEPRALALVEEAVEQTAWGTVDNWCEARNIKRSRLVYLMRSASRGHNVWGAGNLVNKWRDRNDDRVFKTHTAWIAHCLKQDFEIEL